MAKACLPALILVLAATAAAAQQPRPPRPESPPPRPGEITPPEWRTLPTAEDILSVYPVEANLQNVGGRAIIGCTVALSGALQNCKVISEDPPDYGFGLAALKLADKITMTPMKRWGKPVDGGAVRVPIRFIDPDTPAKN